MIYDLLEQAQLLAISNAISPNEESIYRIKCRTYSEKFHTPLHLVYDLDAMLVFQALAEDLYTPESIEEDIEGVLEKLYQIQDPEYSKMTDAEVEDLVDAVINYENKRKGKNKPEKTLLDKNTSEKEVKPVPPKSGGLSFGDLERQEEASESGKAGFKE